MIHRVEIDNFALLEHVELNLGPGLTVLSGETGAGKSILIDALDFASGGRADRTLIRQGADEASVTVLLDCSEDPDDELVIARTLRAAGRSYARINGVMATVGEVRDLMDTRLAIHSQNDQQTIFRASVHRRLLDMYAQKEVLPLIKAWNRERDAVHAINHRLEQLFLDPETRRRRRDILLYQVEEIEAAELVPGEDAELARQIKKDTAVRDIAEHLSQALAVLSSDDTPSVDEGLRRAMAELLPTTRVSTQMQALYDRGEALREEIAQWVDDLARVADRLDIRPDALERANARLATIRRLEDKYGGDIASVNAYAVKGREELERLDATETELARLLDDKQATLEHLRSVASDLKAVRTRAGEALAKAINRELNDLNMQNASFDVEIVDEDLTESFLPNDPHRVQFLIAPNVGEPSMPLVSIVSGGEASRVLLAIKTVLAAMDALPTLIFDEIDTGISGKTSTMIARKLRAIADHRQVLCVTHSAPIAAAADTHFLIGKHVDRGRTRTTVRPIEGEARVAEIARLLSGRPDDDKSRALAQDMLQRP